eukprot:COSAG02_NODE_845_length_16583_cov_7.718272_2_plen_71_part_00
MVPSCFGVGVGTGLQSQQQTPIFGQSLSLDDCKYAPHRTYSDASAVCLIAHQTSVAHTNFLAVILLPVDS